MTDNQEYQEYQEYADTEYNKRLVHLADKYLELKRVTLQQDITSLQEGARKLAKSVDTKQFPEIQKICDTLDKIKIV